MMVMEAKRGGKEKKEEFVQDIPVQSQAGGMEWRSPKLAHGGELGKEARKGQCQHTAG